MVRIILATLLMVEYTEKEHISSQMVTIMKEISTKIWQKDMENIDIVMVEFTKAHGKTTFRVAKVWNNCLMDKHMKVSFTRVKDMDLALACLLI